jgi:hypothetical protein
MSRRCGGRALKPVFEGLAEEDFVPSQKSFESSVNSNNFYPMRADSIIDLTMIYASPSTVAVVPKLAYDYRRHSYLQSVIVCCKRQCADGRARDRNHLVSMLLWDSVCHAGLYDYICTTSLPS